MYRAVTLAFQEVHPNVATWTEDKVRELLPRLELSMGVGGQVYLGDRDVTSGLRSKEVTESVSRVSAMGAVREAMVKLQREVTGKLIQGNAEPHGVVIDGRDIGSHVFPGARHRFYLDATLEERARRRQAQEGDGTLQDWMERIERRDRQDSQRTVAPLTIPEGARVVDTTGMTEQEVVSLIVEVVTT